MAVMRWAVVNVSVSIGNIFITRMKFDSPRSLCCNIVISHKVVPLTVVETRALYVTEDIRIIINLRTILTRMFSCMIYTDISIQYKIKLKTYFAYIILLVMTNQGIRKWKISN
jgi:hypothetical protein